MSQSHSIFDCMFDLAHIIKIMAYMMVGTGLVLSMSDLFRSAEDAKLMAFAVKHTQHGVVILNPKARIEFVNRGFEKLTGYSQHEAIDHSLTQLLTASMGSISKWEELESHMTRGVGCELELSCSTSGGTEFWGLAELYPVSNSQGEARKFILFLRDITLQRKGEEEKARLTEELLSVSRRAGMSEIATGTLHNVGNVLNSVNVSVSLLMDNSRNSNLKYLDRIIEMISEASDFSTFVHEDAKGQKLPDTLAMIADRLNKDKEANESKLRSLAGNVEHIKQIISMQQSLASVGGVNEMIDIADVVRDAVKMHEVGISRHGIEVVWEIADDLPLVCTDRHKVLQILVNFIGNAKQAMSSHGGTDHTLTLALEKDNDEIRIRVRDTGYGIKSENLSKIFSHGFTTKPDGHGFGLHSSALAAKDLGGSVLVQSDGEGRGATFTLRIPLAEEACLPVS
ncbi:MAG: two-component system sensor histidine kinase NtrB [Aureliella sp.]